MRDIGTKRHAISLGKNSHIASFAYTLLKLRIILTTYIFKTFSRFACHINFNAASCITIPNIIRPKYVIWPRHMPAPYGTVQSRLWELRRIVYFSENL